MIQIKKKLENKTPDTSDLVKKTHYNTKITKIEGKIPSISGLATNAALTTVKNRIPNISSLVKKKQIIAQKFQKLKRNFLIMIMVNIFQLQILIVQLLMFLMEDQRKKIW